MTRVVTDGGASGTTSGVAASNDGGINGGSMGMIGNSGSGGAGDARGMGGRDDGSAVNTMPPMLMLITAGGHVVGCGDDGSITAGTGDVDRGAAAMAAKHGSCARQQPLTAAIHVHETHAQNYEQNVDEVFTMG